jgi:hypothetical protein
MSVKVSEPPAVFTQAASILELTSSVATDVPAPEMEIGTAAGSLFFEATSGLEEVSRGAYDIRMVESEHSKDLMGPAGSSISSQSTASPPAPDPVEALRPRAIT